MPDAGIVGIDGGCLPPAEGSGSVAVGGDRIAPKEGADRVAPKVGGDIVAPKEEGSVPPLSTLLSEDIDPRPGRMGAHGGAERVANLESMEVRNSSYCSSDGRNVGTLKVRPPSIAPDVMVAPRGKAVVLERVPPTGNEDKNGLGFRYSASFYAIIKHTDIKNGYGTLQRNSYSIYTPEHNWCHNSITLELLMLIHSNFHQRY